VVAITTLFPVLGKRRRQLAGTLSGGEQQMLAIGRALMSRPRMLLMDEPTMGLAPQMVETILERILDIRRLGTTILLVEQNAVEAIRLSDMVYVLRLGRVVHQGPGSEIGKDLLRTLYLGHDL
jgi:branched-chain amino acid transport system ATP-binding protein